MVGRAQIYTSTARGDLKMNQSISLKRNVYKDYIFTLLQNVDFTRGIWMIYLAEKGMSLTQIGLLETIFHITSFSMEVPTGAVADIFGRKVSRILGRILYLISRVLLLMSNNFLLFAVSFICTALSYNLESGAGDALVYDSLKEIGEEDSYMKISGKKEIFYQTASTISFFIGGYLAVKSYYNAFTITIIIAVLASLQTFTFKEPSIGKNKEHTNKGNIFITQLKESIKVVRNNPKLGFLIIFSQTISSLSACIFFYLQNYLKGFGYSEAAIGTLFAISSLAAAVTATQVYKIEKKIKEKGILLVTPFITSACMWGVALSKYNYVFFILLTITESIIFVSVNDYINKRIPSENRATILSFASMVFSFFMITMFPVVGMIGDRFSLSLAFKIMGVVSSILVVINCFILSVNKKKVQKDYNCKG